MLQCLSLKPSSPTPSSLPTSPYPPLSSEANSTDGTPGSSMQVSREYTFALQTNSFKEIESIVNNPEVVDQEVLNPNKECVEEALRHTKPNTLTRLVSTYFDHSENSTNLYRSLHQSIRLAREIYAPISHLLETIPPDSHSLTQSECDWVYDIFLEFDSLDNPFPSRGSNNFHEMRDCFLKLREELDKRLEKSKSRALLCQHGRFGSALCLVGTAVAVVVSAAALATHALVAIVVAPFCTTCFTRDFNKKEVAHMRQLKAASKGTFALYSDLDTIDCLVASLHSAIEGDKQLIRMGLERGRDTYPIQEVVKQLHKYHVNFNSRLKDLEDLICLCFKMVNRTRSLLLQEIHFQSSSN